MISSGFESYGKDSKLFGWKLFWISTLILWLSHSRVFLVLYIRHMLFDNILSALGLLPYDPKKLCTYKEEILRDLYQKTVASDCWFSMVMEYYTVPNRLVLWYYLYDLAHPFCLLHTISSHSFIQQNASLWS